MVLLACFLALLATSLLATWSLRVEGAGINFLVALTVATAIVVGLTLLLSLFSAYDVAGIAIGQAVLLIVAAGVWIARGRPAPDRPSLPDRAALLALVRANRTVSVLLGAVAVAALVELILALGVAPNTWDSMMYHLSRVALWIQDGSVFHFDGGTAYEREYAPNGEITYGWTLLLWDGDRFAALVPWLFSLGCGVLVYEGARLLRFARAPALFAACMFLLLPQVLVQASSTLIDLQAAFFVGAFALFGVRAAERRSRADLLVASLALGLAVGTKGTFVLAVAGLVTIAVAVVVGWRVPRRHLLAAAAALAAGLVLFGAPQYLINAVESGSPEGGASADARRTSSLPTTSVRTAASFIDLPGMAGTLPAQLTQRLHDRVWPSGSDPFNDTAVTEDGLAFGPLAPLLLFPLLVYYLFSRRAGLDRRLTAFASIASVATYAVLFEPAFNTSHVLVTGVLIGAPLLARAGEIAWLRHLAAAVAIAFAAVVLVQNMLKPLYPDPALGLPRYEQQSLQHEFAPALEKLDEVIPADARLAYFGPRGATWDYPFFGPHLDRYVYRVEADQTPSLSEVREVVAGRDLDAVVFAGVEPPPGLETTDLGEIAFSDHRVWLRAGGR